MEELTPVKLITEELLITEDLTTEEEEAEDLTPEEIDLLNSCLNKQQYEIYIKVKNLTDDVQVKYDLVNHKSEYYVTETMDAGTIKEIGKQLEDEEEESE